MTASALTALAPYIVLTGGVTLMLLAISFIRRGPVTLALTLVVLLATLASVGFATGAGTQLIDGFVVVDGYAHFFTALFVLASATTAVLTYGYVDRRAAQREEFYILLLTATLGAMTMGAAAHFGAFLLGMEILSISLYAMIAYPDSGRPRWKRRSNTWCSRGWRRRRSCSAWPWFTARPDPCSSPTPWRAMVRCCGSARA